ncbi:outer membrane protein assembly factor BamE domain-containing protein [Noviherbaspirillum galbum]|uniref:outer membrane protein assembly factor BamE domain-containing protein n=1 Tax=Noviherbaspirillum galbum TaxID=2709383 RepID=UPI002E2C6548|nr:outer membrane protein assembly factor BamE [Noviherbaspirillum galbum]
MRRLLTLLFSLLALVGCDRQGRPVEEFGLDKLAKGVSTESEVRMVMGEPDHVRTDPQGAKILEYPKGPEGARTWFFLIGSDGKLVDYQQVLNEKNFARITQGMTQEEVRDLLGRPRSVVQFKRKNEEVWDWRYLSGTEPRLFNVHFDIDTRRVTGTSSLDANNY